MWFREWSPDNYHTVYFCPVKDIIGAKGFASVYAFKKQDVETMKANQSVAGCSNFEVWADRLILDLDDGEASIEPLENELKKRKLAYRIWLSGYKGYHVEILTNALSGLDLPYNHFLYAQTLCPKTDPSVYRHCSLIRLPNTLHKKSTPNNQLRKKIIKTVSGGKIVFNSLVRNPNRDFTFNLPDEFFSDDWLEVGLSQYSRNINKSPPVGRRYLTLWSCANNLKKAGLSYDAIRDLLLLLNKSWGANAHCETEVFRALKGK